MARQIIIVTGSNKGIGKAIVGSLLERSTDSAPLLIYLTGRSPSLVSGAVKELSANTPQHLPIETFAKYLKDEHGQVDVIVNNAGIATKGSLFNGDVVKTTLLCNYYGTQEVTASLAPLVKSGGRIVNVSSMAGKLKQISSKKLIESFTDPELSMEQLDGLMEQFQTDVEAGNHTEKGWPSSAYGISKVGLTALTMVTARQYPDLLVNACCPGWVKTDMAGDRAPKTPKQGAVTPVKLAIGDIGTTTGEFWENEHVSDWASGLADNLRRK